MDFSGANPNGQMGGNELLPKGTLAWCNVTVRPFNMDQGEIETPSKSTQGNAYLDLELTILDGPYARRKVWDRPGVAGSEKYVQAGFAAIRHILEVGRNAGPQNQAGYQINDYLALDNITCAIKIGVDPAKDGYEAKNTVACYLSPNPESDTHKDFERLRTGDTAPKVAADTGLRGSTAAIANAPKWGPQGTGAAPAAQSNPTAAAQSSAQQTTSRSSWGPQQSGTPTPAAQNSGTKPSWLGSPQT